MKNLLKIIWLISMFVGLANISNAASLAHSNLNPLTSSSLKNSPYALNCQNKTGTKKCSLVKKAKVGNLHSPVEEGGDTEGTGIATDSSGNVYITGYTDVGINGQKQNGNTDCFVIKYSSTGRLLWTQQVGGGNGSGETSGSGIAIDSSKNVYITGSTDIGINGQKQNGYLDYFVVKYDANGQMQWTQQVGGNGSGVTEAKGVATDSGGNVYITGNTDVGINGQKQNGDIDYFVVKYYPNGKMQWAQQVGSAGYDANSGYTMGNGIATDGSGNVYITGNTDVGINGQKQNGGLDYFIVKYDPNGKMQWAQQVGGFDSLYHVTYGNGITTDSSGNIYITGGTTVGINGQKQNGNYDYFVVKYYPNGKTQWTQQVGSDDGMTSGNAIATDSDGNIYITGSTDSGINGQKQNTIVDYFITKYDANGQTQWAQQIGVGDSDVSDYNYIATDSRGNPYITGTTELGINGQPQNGLYDAFIIRYDSNSGFIQWNRQVGG